MATAPAPVSHVSELSPAQRKALKARAHGLEPVVLIGDQGLTGQVIAETGRALEAHELIKVRAAGLDRAARAALLSDLCARTGAQPVQHIGNLGALPPAARGAGRGRRRDQVPR